MDRLIRLLGVIGLLVIGLAACSGGTTTSPIEPAIDRPTFLYFYTEN